MLPIDAERRELPITHKTPLTTLEACMTQETLTITDNRTGRTYEIPIQNGSIKANDLRQIKVNADDFGVMSYDPGFKNTASTKSTITYIDGDAGILEYSGYPIDQLAEKATYLEVAYPC